MIVTETSAPLHKRCPAAQRDASQPNRDGGVTWAPIPHNLPGTDIHGFAQDANNPKRLYAYVVGAGVLASADGGTTWGAVPTQPPNGGNRIVLATNATGLYATATTGLAVSHDQGTSWEPVPGQPGGVISVATAPDNPLLLYAGTPNGLVKTSDGGKTWSSIGPRGVIVVAALAIAPTDPNRVVFVTQTGALYRRDDAGKSWRSPQ